MSVVEKPTLFGITPGAAPVPDAPPGIRHPAVAAWFARRFPEGPTPAQVGGWAHIAAGRDTLIAAPTGSGKTLAGFLVGIDRLYCAHAAGADVTGAAQVAYVSPLRALAVDIAENLDRPLAEIAALSAELGLDAPNLTVGVRTGDSTSRERASLLRRPPNFVVTTPESLYLLVTAGRGRQMLRSVETVIVDEIHAMARDKRGSHLALTLERLEHATRGRPQRIGLSATQRPLSVVAHLLCGTGAPEPCAVVDVGHRRHLDLALELPQGELEAVASAEQMGDVLDRIAALVGEHRTTIVFVNTRRLAERLAHQLGERLGDDVVAAHHGSLSKDRRYRIESSLRAGDLRALVATASLELGIDIGPVELVCQVGSPRSIATFLQRVGRSGHSRAGTPKGRLFPLTRDELVECAALLVAVEQGDLDVLAPPVAPLDILAQQIVAEVGAADPGGGAGPEASAWRTDDLYDLVRRAHPFSGVSRETFDEIVDLASRGIETGRGRRAAYLHHDGVNGELRPRAGARFAALTSGGAIPEIGDYRVVLEPDETFVGTVNEDFAVESLPGDIFLLGTHSWQVRQVATGVVRVTDAEGKPPTIPFWTGEAPARTAELSAQVSRVRSTLERYLAAGDPAGARSWLGGVAPLDDAAVTQIVDYVAAGRAVLGVVPTDDLLVFERFFDETDGMHLVIHSPHGGRVNRALGLALRKKFCRSFNFELQAAANDDAVVLSLGPHHSFPLADVPRFLTAASVRDTLTQAVLDSPMFQSRWRWNLNRSLIVLRFKGGRRNPPPIQRMEADDLMAAIFPQAAACQENVTGPVEIPDHPIVRQTMHDTLTEGLDIDGLERLLARIESGAVTIQFRDTTEASVFAHEILTARPYAFLDDEAEPFNRRTTAVSLRRGLPVDLSTIGRLDPAAITRVREEVAPDPGTPDELHDVLLSLVVTPARDGWRALFDDLAARGRVGSAVVDGTERWWATESGGPASVVTTGVEHGDHPVERVAAAVLRGHLDIAGPASAADLGRVTGLAPGRVAMGIAVLEAEGFALQGTFTADAEATGETEWCARRLLARIHGYSRKARRSGFEPVSAQDLMRFLLRWQHVAPGTELHGTAGVRRVVEQLQGFEAGAATWEPEILRRRVSGYSPAFLDQLSLDGEVTWLRLSAWQPATDRRSTPSKATPITLMFRDDQPWLLAAARLAASPAAPGVGATAEIVEALAAGGARFASELATATGRLATDIESALWDGVARGLLTADGFAAIRSLVGGSGNALRRPISGTASPAGASGVLIAGRRPPGRVSRLRRGAPSPTTAAGRWSLVGDPGSGEDREPLAEALADQLLQRWGVVFRDLAVHQGLPLPWREVQWALRRLEDRGLVRGGRFVTGFSGEQYALPAAVEALAATRRAPRTGERVTVNATDPLNLTGVVIPGPRIPSVRTRTVTYIDGLPEGCEDTQPGDRCPDRNRSPGVDSQKPL